MSVRIVLREAADAVGSSARLAALIGVTRQAVHDWEVHDRVPAKRCIAIEEATQGKVTRYRLRPDVFGPEPQ